MSSATWAWVKSTSWLIPMAWAFSDAIASIVKVQGQSMQPTLNNDPEQSDWVLVEKISAKWLKKYQRGSVVVLWAPDSPHQQLIKRIIGVEGDYVRETGKKEPTHIRQGRCWLEGDNAAKSGDSRNLWGPVHLGLIEGRCLYVVWPLKHIRRIATYVPEGKLVSEDTAGA